MKLFLVLQILFFSFYSAISQGSKNISIPSGFLEHPNFIILKKDTFPIYMAHVLVKNKPSHKGVLWDVLDDKVILLPTDQYLEWKQSKLNSAYFQYKEIPAKYLKHMKIYREGRKIRSTLVGAGIGILMGGVIGTIFKSKDNKDCISEGLIECLGSPHQVRYNIIFWGSLGTLTGLAVGSLKFHLRINQDTAESYKNQKEKIKRYAVFSR